MSAATSAAASATSVAYNRPSSSPRVARIAKPFYAADDDRIRVYQGDSLRLLPQLGLEGKVDLIFADPPYFLSNGGMTCKSGTMASVNKGKWDQLESIEQMHSFNRKWLTTCKDLLAPNGSILVSGTRHVIFSVGFALQQLGFKLLNDITWEKPNPPPNLSCRYFTHASETILWAAKGTKSKHTFNYAAMREQNGGKQMKSVWRITPPRKIEKQFGKHPTQKPIALLDRIVEACSNPGDLVLDPFLGSGTTAVAAASADRRFVGIDLDRDYLDLTVNRVEDVLEP